MQNHLVFNPYLPLWEYVPDGEPHLFNGRVYIYGSHDVPQGTAYCMGDYVCWSADENDLSSWRYEGVIYRRTDDPSNTDGKYKLFAPDVCQGKDGRYYLYYGLSKVQSIGVAVSDTPAGHYRFLSNLLLPNGQILNTDSGYGIPFDPAVYTENDEVWLYYGFGLNPPHRNISSPLGAYVVKLNADMMHAASEPVLLVPSEKDPLSSFQAHPFLEAPSMRKLRGRYYFIYSSIQGHELCYGISDSPEKPPVYQGVLISNGDIGLEGHESEDKSVTYLGNNHGSILKLKDKHYIFYHRHTHGTQFSRQGCAEEIQLRSDGSIPQAEITSCGLNNGPLPARGEYPAAIACALHGSEGAKHFSSKVLKTDADACIFQDSQVNGTSAEVYIANLRDQSGCGFKYLEFDGTETSCAIEIRNHFEGVIQLHIDEENSDAWAEFSVSAQTNWHWLNTEIRPIQGKHAIYFTFRGKGACDMRAFRFEASSCN